MTVGTLQIVFPEQSFSAAHLILTYGLVDIILLGFTEEETALVYTMFFVQEVIPRYLSKIGGMYPNCIGHWALVS